MKYDHGYITFDILRWMFLLYYNFRYQLAINIFTVYENVPWEYMLVPRA